MNAAVPSSMVENTANVSIPENSSMILNLYAGRLQLVSKDTSIEANALFRELERYSGIKFLQTGEIYLNQSLRKQFVDFYVRLFQIGMTMLKSTP